MVIEGEFYIMVELNWEGSAPAACAAGLFLNNLYALLKLYIFILLKRKVAWKFNLVWIQVTCQKEKIKGYPNMPSNKGVTNFKYVLMSQKVT